MLELGQFTVFVWRTKSQIWSNTLQMCKFTHLFIIEVIVKGDGVLLDYIILRGVPLCLHTRGGGITLEKPQYNIYITPPLTYDLSAKN